MGDPLLIAKLMPDASAKRRWIKFGALQLALVMLILMVARPQMGTKVSNEKRNGIECIIAMDISNSMLAEDVQPSRLDKSKMLVENLVDKFNNDKIGLIVFAGEAFVQLPITSDYVSAKMFMHGITPDLIATQGTDIAEAINIICFTMRVHSNLVGSVPGKSQTNNSGSDKRELYTIAQALQKPYHDLLFTVHRIIIKFNEWEDVTPDCPFIQLTTLDENKDAKKVSTEENP